MKGHGESGLRTDSPPHKSHSGTAQWAQTADLGREASASGGVEHNGDGVWVAVRESHAVVHSGQRQDAAQAEPAGPQRVAPAVQRGDLAVQGVTTKRERERGEGQVRSNNSSIDPTISQPVYSSPTKQDPKMAWVCLLKRSTNCCFAE